MRKSCYVIYAQLPALIIWLRPSNVQTLPFSSAFFTPRLWIQLRRPQYSIPSHDHKVPSPQGGFWHELPESVVFQPHHSFIPEAIHQPPIPSALGEWLLSGYLKTQSFFTKGKWAYGLSGFWKHSGLPLCLAFLNFLVTCMPLNAFNINIQLVRCMCFTSIAEW